MGMIGHRIPQSSGLTPEEVCLCILRGWPKLLAVLIFGQYIQ